MATAPQTPATATIMGVDLLTALAVIAAAALFGAIAEYCGHAIHHGHKKGHR